MPREGVIRRQRAVRRAHRAVRVVRLLADHAVGGGCARAAQMVAVQVRDGAALHHRDPLRAKIVVLGRRRIASHDGRFEIVADIKGVG